MVTIEQERKLWKNHKAFKVKLMVEHEIVIQAQSEEEAISYMKKNTEWFPSISGSEVSSGYEIIGEMKTKKDFEGWDNDDTPWGYSPFHSLGNNIDSPMTVEELTGDRTELDEMKDEE